MSALALIAASLSLFMLVLVIDDLRYIRRWTFWLRLLSSLVVMSFAIMTVAFAAFGIASL